MTQVTKVPTFTLKVTHPSYKLMDCKAQLIPHLVKLGFMPRDIECLITNTMAQLKNGKTYFLSLVGDKPSRANDYTTSFQLTSMGDSLYHEAMFTKDPIIIDGDAVYAVTLEQAAKAGEPIKRKPDAKQVWHINHRNRKTKTSAAEYSLSLDDDMNRELFLKAGTTVYVGFSY